MVDRISGLIEEEIHQLHADLVEVEYRREDGDQFLRIYIDHNDGVSLDLCSSISRVVKEIIDTAEIDYDHLEVSSPGIDRKLKTDQDFLRFQGNKVKVKLTRNYSGPRQVIGILTGYSDEVLEVEAEQGLESLPRQEITVVRLHPDVQRRNSNVE